MTHCAKRTTGLKTRLIHILTLQSRVLKLRHVLPSSIYPLIPISRPRDLSALTSKSNSQPCSGTQKINIKSKQSFSYSPICPAHFSHLCNFPTMAFYSLLEQEETSAATTTEATEVTTNIPASEDLKTGELLRRRQPISNHTYFSKHKVHKPQSAAEDHKRRKVVKRVRVRGKPFSKNALCSIRVQKSRAEFAASHS